MDSQLLKIILVEDNLADALLIEEFLSEVSQTPFEITAVKRLNEGLNYLEQTSFDIILLDLSLPDSHGIDTVIQVITQVPNLPIVILTAMDDERLALESVRQGAQDYLVKGRFEGELLIRAMRYAIERQRIEETRRLQAERERLLGRILERIRQSLDLNEILQTAVTEVRQFLKTDRVLIYRCEASTADIAAPVSLNPETGGIVVEAAEIDECEIETPGLYHALARPCLIIANPQLVQAVEDVNTVDLEPSYKTVLNQGQIQAILSVPILQNQTLKRSWELAANKLKTDNSNRFFSVPFSPYSSLSSPLPNCLWGLLIAYHCKSSRHWQQWEIDFLKQLADQLAIAIQQSELYHHLEIANQQLLKLASLDGLTGVANRRQFDQVLVEEWQRLAQEKAPLSLILCDIDFFKLYNDHYGHPAGDACLKQVSMAITKAAKGTHDLVARYGGEEFAIILPRSTAKDAMGIAQAIRHQVLLLKLPHAQSAISSYITLSLGIASIIPCSHRSPSLLIKIADQSLYQAKAQGRDKIVQSDTYDWDSCLCEAETQEFISVKN